AVQKEMTTPTGAAILKVLTDEWIPFPSMEIIATAYGIGHRDVEIPNVLRVYETQAKIKTEIKKSIMMECNIDDMSPEELALVPELLLKAEARDAFLTPILMKKGRASTMLSVLCEENNVKTISEMIFLHTSTIGLRQYAVDKIELPRTAKTRHTEWGEVNYKESTLPNGDTRFKIEFDDLKTLADKHKVSISKMRNRIKL
ncbi:MAG: LarC family nickel insertion protein, partial [Bacteroidales bacterium]|nr:LarC family nickel insertion protein [Bacteroidales bacterium]